jgi:hypothetical protein
MSGSVSLRHPSTPSTRASATRRAPTTVASRGCAGSSNRQRTAGTRRVRQPEQTLRASSDLTSRLDVLRADDDLVGTRNRHPVRRAGAHVGLARQARDTCAAKQSADDLGFLLRRHDVEHHERVTGHG